MPDKTFAEQNPPQPELIADYACNTGENPLWHPLEQRLYWTDIPAGQLYRYDPANGKHECFYRGRPVGGFTIQLDGALLLFMDRGTISLYRDGVLEEIVPEIVGERASRFNDVIADPAGRVFCGTMSSPEGHGSLYRLDLDGSLHVVLRDVGCSNGMAFSRDNRLFYYTDSFAHEIYVFDYDPADGSIANRRIFATIEESQGLPDGATMDAEGHLWSALWEGSSIVRFDFNGAIESRIRVPARKVTSLTFAGPDLSDIYITTAGGDDRPQDGPFAGALFRIRSKISGRAEFFSRIAFQHQENAPHSESQKPMS